MAVQSKVEGSDMRPAEASPILMPVIVLLLSIGACATIPPDGSPMPVAQCNAEGAKPGAMGKVASADVVERARKDAGARMARVLKPGQMVTMEYAEGRLNIDVDARNVIINLRCG